MLSEHKTISIRSDVPDALSKFQDRPLQPQTRSTPRSSAIPRRKEEYGVALSFSQQRLWFLDQLYPQNPLYNFPVAFRVSGTLNIEALQRSLSAIVERHEVLRAHFTSLEGNPIQIVSTPQTFNLPLIDLSTMDSQASQEAEVQRILTAESQRPFNLGRDLMIRCLLLKLDSTEHIYMVTIHHIATDAWSMGVFFRELSICYEAFDGGRSPKLPELLIQYSDFSAWQRERLKGDILENQLEYWKQRLAGAKETLDLPTDHPRSTTQTFRGDTQNHVMHGALAEDLRKFSRREGVTLFMTLLAAFQTLLYRYSRQEDILVGAPVAGRSRIETENSIGFFVNTLVLRTNLSGNPTFLEFLGRVRDTSFGAFENQELPFEKLVEELHPERNGGQSPFIQAMFVFQNALAEGASLANLILAPLEVRHGMSKFDLTLFVEERGKEINVGWEYNADLFEPETISRMGAHLQVLLKGIVTNPKCRLSDLPLLTGEERERILVEWNSTQSAYPRDSCVHELFEEQVRQRPDAVAVTFNGNALTYAELNERSNQLAHYLRRSGVTPGMLVGILVERSLEMVVGLLGILKAGGAYAALDTSCPKERLSYIWEDLRSPFLLLQHRFVDSLPGGVVAGPEKAAPRIISLDADWKAVASESKSNVPIQVAAESAVYVSFTSGSTGRPKGVCVPHRAVVRLVKGTSYASFSTGEVFLQMAPLAFDASTFEIWGSLLNGSKLVVLPPQTPTLSDLAQTIQSHRVTTLWLTSGLFNQMVDEKPEGLKNLDQIITGGDVLSVPHVKKALTVIGSCRLINGYGPTENTTFTTCHTIPPDFDGSFSVPVGRPISNTRCYVLDDRLQPVPIGVPGELYVAGDGLAIGYVNQPGLTAERFLTNPFEPKSRIYRTGDLVRYLSDGNIEFLGRLDHQVKIRGFRVELGEVESVLSGHPQLRECAVVACENSTGEKQLVAYVVANRQAGAAPNELRTYLREKLPECMIPAIFVKVEALPLTKNGKIDRGALPIPKEENGETNKKYVAPKDPVEVELTEIWESILGVRPISTQDRFFDLGGHSLLAVRLLARVEKKLGRKLPVSVVFQAQTIAQMANYLREEGSLDIGSSIVEIQAKGSNPPLFFVHGVGGGMFWGYTNLARSLGMDQPLYALKSRSMDGKEEFARIEDMAAKYVADVRAFQPKGPYHLGGYCFGGVVAYEMSRQLLAAGESVAFLGAMNCSPPNSSYGIMRLTPEVVFKFLRNFFRLAWRSVGWGAQQRKEFVRWKAALMRRKLVRLFNLPGTVAARIEVDQIVDLSSFPEDQRKLWETHIRALINYFPQRYAGKVSLFRSRGHPLFSSYDPRYGWGDLASEVEVHLVPGAHESILEEPHVRSLGEKMKQCLAIVHGLQKTKLNLPSDMGEEIAGPGVPSTWNETRTDYPKHLCIHQLFEEQVKRTPNAAAVIWHGQELSYDELNRRANSLAHHLGFFGVGPDVPVGLCVDRSIDLLVGVLGILKAGGAYMALDPAYPKERLGMMLEDSRARVLVTQQRLLSALPSTKIQLLCLDAPVVNTHQQQNPASSANPRSLAYIIYTSGSTGQPKGVAMEHKPLVNLIWWQLKNSTLGKGDRTLQFASPSFDVSFQEMFSTWCSGGTLALADEELRQNPSKLLRFLHDHNINRLFLPFVMLNQLAESFVDADRAPAALREIITAGEQLRITGKIATFFEKLPGCRLHNHYGPSESHVVTTHTLSGGPSDWPALPPIGRPIANTRIHLLDDALNPVPVGEPGEIFIGGDCLARGYLHRPDLTSERFVADPFGQDRDARLYKTGDLAKCSADGNLEFLGRVDHQVKIRGYRVELSEIEAVLGRVPFVCECAVMAREDDSGQKRLIGYVVTKAGDGITVDTLRAALQEKLPAYMVPSAFVFLDALPLTPSGKLNRSALPVPDQDRPILSSQYVAPTNETEEKIAAIWREVLNLKEVGIRDDFFGLGGHSLLVAQVISRIRVVFELELPTSSLFDSPTIADLAEGLAKGRWDQERVPDPPILAVQRNGNPPLSFAQRRLWFIDRLEPGTHAYNMPTAVELKGALNMDALQQSLDQIARRHESLRTTICFADGNLSQVVGPIQPVKLEILELRDVPLPSRQNQARKIVEEQASKAFDLERGPLWRLVLLRLDTDEYILLVVMHHIISDGWSLAVFFNELDLLYQAFSVGQPTPKLPALTVQYADYAIWQQHVMQGKFLEKEVLYWKEKLFNAPPSIELPVDHARDSIQSCKSLQHSITLPRALTESILALSRNHGFTPFMTLSAALAITLHRWTNQRDIVIGTVVAGRNRREIENLIGCFMNFVPVRSKITDEMTAQEFLEKMKSFILDAHAHQDCPFEKMVEAVNPERRLAQNPLYNVAFLMQNFPIGGFSARGLKAKTLAVDLHSALLDLRFVAEEAGDEISFTCEYQADLFEPQTIRDLMTWFRANVEALVEDRQRTISNFELTEELSAQAKAAKDIGNRQLIAISATFTAEPVEESLKYWSRQLQLPARIEFAPFNQVFQQLLDTAGLLSGNQNGLNVVLVRFEDWEQFKSETRDSASFDAEDNIRRNVEEFACALKAAVCRGTVPYLVCICPASSALLENPTRSQFFKDMEDRIEGEMEKLAGAYLVRTAELAQTYPITDYYDPMTEEIGGIPYTPAFLAALGTMIARKLHAIKRPPYKAIVLDCDETLWAGVCGEDGPMGIQLDPPRRALQEFMRKQYDAGMLLCLCSKNSEEDVTSVFEHRVDMPLRREHLAAWRINWRQKSENVKSLANELRLGLNSFIFVDDNPVECAEVEANCPGVLTLQLPETPELIPQFLQHCWAFDHIRVSAEDTHRSVSYQQEKHRETLRKQSSSLADFLAGLELKVTFEGLSEAHLTRAAQLTLRTNQFNFTTRRRTEGDVRALKQRREQELITVSVSDRFGAYGLVGLMIYCAKGGSLEVDTFLLSCRVLGRGVECQMVEKLGQIALARGLGRVDLHFVPSAKNSPAYNFLEKIGARFRQGANGGYVYRLPSEFAASAALSSSPTDDDLPKLPLTAAESTNRIDMPGHFLTAARYRMIALEANDPDKILQAIDSKSRIRTSGPGFYAAPRTEMEKMVCEIYQDLLRVERVGIDDSFFELGGHSLLAVRLFAEVERLTGRKLPLVTLFQNSTVRQLSELLSQKSAARSCVFPIQAQGASTPLFLIHGAGGDVLWGYANLAPYLGSNQSVYGIKSRALTGAEEFSSIEEMASYYIEQVRAFQKNGPYQLGGYCFGGNVAYEMARQLTALGEQVALVALLDAAPSNRGYEVMKWWRPDFSCKFAINFSYWMHDFMKTSPADRRDFILRKSRTLRRKIMRRLLRPGTPIAQVDLEAVIDPAKFPQHELKLWQAHLDALERHVSQPYSGRVTLFRTRGQPLFCSLESDFGWGKLAQGGVEIKLIPGSHESIFMEPDVRSLATQLKTCLSPRPLIDEHEKA